MPQTTKVLCLAGHQSTRLVVRTAALQSLSVECCSSIAEATRIWASNPNTFTVVVAALGTRPVDMIFDRGSSSSLLTALAAHRCRPRVVIFSRTACRKPAISRACVAAGADVVIESEHMLLEEFRAVAQRNRRTEVLAQIQTATRLKPPPPHGHSYSPVVQRLARDAVLAAQFGEGHRTVQRSRRVTAELEAQACTVPGCGLRPPAQAPRQTVRIVHVSDTHNHHQLVSLPPGDLLLHTGDLVANYGKEDTGVHFESALCWLAAASKRYEAVMFIAGNHDTLLDTREYGWSALAQTAQTQLACFLAEHRNVHYLKNSRATFRGIQVWGSPVCVSRLETEHKRYYSDAFERTASERSELWCTPRPPADILMTHTPPGHILGTGCHELHRAIYGEGSIHTPPQLHVFGHDHGGFGVHYDGRTVFMNAAQEELISMDGDGGGTALVYDYELEVVDSESHA